MKRMICVLMMLLSLPLTALSVKRVYYEEPDTVDFFRDEYYKPYKIDQYDFIELTIKKPQTTIAKELLGLMETIASRSWYKTFLVVFDYRKDSISIRINDSDFWHTMNYVFVGNIYGMYQINTTMGIKKFIIINNQGEIALKKEIESIFETTNTLLCYRYKLIDVDYVMRGLCVSVSYEGVSLDNSLKHMDFLLMNERINLSTINKRLIFFTPQMLIIYPIWCSLYGIIKYFPSA